MNLTGLDLAEQGPAAIDRLLIEPLVAAKHVRRRITRMIDIGSGGGSPAIPLGTGAFDRRTCCSSRQRRESPCFFAKRCVRWR